MSAATVQAWNTRTQHVETVDELQDLFKEYNIEQALKRRGVPRKDSKYLNRIGLSEKVYVPNLDTIITRPISDYKDGICITVDEARELQRKEAGGGNLV